MTGYEEYFHALRESEGHHNTLWKWEDQFKTSATGVGTTLFLLYLLLTYIDIPLLRLPGLLRELITSGWLQLSGGGIASTGPRKEDMSLRTQQNGTVLKKVLGIDGSSLLQKLPSNQPARRLSVLLKGPQTNAPPGLGNWDNSCYQNSMIQGLASLNSVEAFLSQSAARYENLRNEDSTTGALLHTIWQLNDANNAGQRLWTPGKLKSMSSWQQQDAQEYFSKVWDQIEKESTKALQTDISHAGLEQSTAHYESGTDHNQKSSAFRPTLRAPLDGLMAQRVGCMNCGYSEGLSMNPFNCLTVPLGSKWTYAIGDCLNECTKLELIEGVNCAKCTLIETKHNLERLLASSSSTPTTPATLRQSLMARIEVIGETLEEEDFSDDAIIKKCLIPKKNWISTTKSRQAVIARPPGALVIHVNRSMFDEYTGAQLKNYANVTFPMNLDFSPWCLGGSTSGNSEIERWNMDPSQSMLQHSGTQPAPNTQYELRAVVTHYGRHENGHYICYRSDPFEDSDKSDLGGCPGSSSDSSSQQWWCLSDEDVSSVQEAQVLDQGGVFMLFYERVHSHASEKKSPSNPAAQIDEIKPCWTPHAEQPPALLDKEIPQIDGTTDAPSATNRSVTPDLSSNSGSREASVSSEPLTESEHDSSQTSQQSEDGSTPHALGASNSHPMCTSGDDTPTYGKDSIASTVNMVAAT